MTLVGVTYLLMVGATATAAGVARQRRDEHLPVALLLGANLLASAIRTLIAPFIFTAPGDPPLVGVARALAHVDEGFQLIGPLSTAGAALVVFARRSALPALLAWVVATAALAATYPTTRGDVLRKVYLAIELCSLFTAFVSISVFLRRRDKAGQWEAPKLPHFALAMIVAIDVVSVVFGPWRFGLYTGWELAQYAACVCFGILILLQGGVMCIHR